MKPGTSLEEDVRHVYSYLLNMRDEGVVVGNSVVMTGKSGVQHEIDVFYEFARVGIRHRVAIECKDWERAVSKGQIQEFESKLRDIGNITGVVISRNGYQSGAEDFAKYHDILALRFEDLPAIHVRLAERIRTVALPDESYVGEPFWIIMEVRDGKVTGSHYGMPFPGSDKVFIPHNPFEASCGTSVPRSAPRPPKLGYSWLATFCLARLSRHSGVIREENELWWGTHLLSSADRGTA